MKLPRSKTSSREPHSIAARFTTRQSWHNRQQAGAATVTHPDGSFCLRSVAPREWRRDDRKQAQSRRKQQRHGRTRSRTLLETHAPRLALLDRSCLDGGGNRHLRSEWRPGLGPMEPILIEIASNCFEADNLTRHVTKQFILPPRASKA
jgi:hypothetical protein